MTHFVGAACINCKHTDCVDVCPVDAFREGKNMLVIDPDECIDCGVCIPECPVSAIATEEDAAPPQLEFVRLNAELSKQWPTIIKTKASMPGAQEWEKVDDKKALLDSRGRDD
ncbi:MAG: ferredoxin family protein [Burkholderiales bacterium]|nr:ferredoxin family protein [Burkholderiales bacterium]